jgi:hypothetical protein
MLLDGPKGRPAVELLAECSEIHPGIILGFVHDARGTSRTSYEHYYPSMFFTDSPGYLAATRYLDDGYRLTAINDLREARGGVEPYPVYGPTLGAIAITDDDRNRLSARRRDTHLLTAMRWAISRRLHTKPMNKRG